MFIPSNRALVGLFEKFLGREFLVRFYKSQSLLLGGAGGAGVLLVSHSQMCLMFGTFVNLSLIPIFGGALSRCLSLEKPLAAKPLVACLLCV